MENGNKMNNELDKITVDFDKFKKIYHTLKKQKVKEVSFEFLVGSCFPDILNNIKAEIRRQYTLGYCEGKKEQETKG